FPYTTLFRSARVECPFIADVNPAGKEVVTQRQVVISEITLIVREKLDTAAEQFITGFLQAARGIASSGEQVFGDVVSHGHAQHFIGADIFDAEQTVKSAELKILAVNHLFLDRAAFDIR